MVATSERSTQRFTPPLENGDRLTRDEFERRYEGMLADCKAQLIEGIVYMSAALRFQSHGKPVTLSEDDYLEGSPELLVEISTSRRCATFRSIGLPSPINYQ